MSAFGSLTASARQALAAGDLSHRPWPPPAGHWVQAQTMEDVLFAHWRVEPAALARLLPPELAVDTFDGEAWLGIVALRVANLRLRGLPPVPGLSSFVELNVRTYVTLADRPGIWFFSLELGNALVVEAMKRLYRLPAQRARIEAGPGTYELAPTFSARYRVEGEPFQPAAGSLEEFLAERFCLYTADGGRLYRAEVHHAPWQLQPAEATIAANTISPIALSDGPHLLYAASQDLLAWGLEEL